MKAENAQGAASATSADSAACQYLTFDLGSDEFALDIRSVREIIQFTMLTSVPMMPSFIRGVINLRGAVVPVIDLQCRFGRSAATVGKKTCIIIFEGKREDKDVTLGLMVDSVNVVMDIAGSDIEPAPEFGTTIHRNFIQGMGKVNGEFIVILNPERAMDVDEMVEVAERAHVHAHAHAPETAYA